MVSKVGLYKWYINLVGIDICSLYLVLIFCIYIGFEESSIALTETPLTVSVRGAAKETQVPGKWKSL